MQRGQFNSWGNGGRYGTIINHGHPIIFFFFLIIRLVQSSLPVEMAAANPIDDLSTSTTVAQSTPSGTSFLENGVYLYGQSRQRDQIGHAYMVFEVKQGRMVGAFYMPHSSFDCFWGSPEGNRLALTVIDSYTQDTHPYAVGFNPSVVAVSTSGGANQQVSLEGFYRIEAVSQTDREILRVCQSDVQQKLGEN